MERITKKWLEKRVEILRNETGVDYRLDYMGLGVRLVVNLDNGGQSDISPRVTKRELNDQITTCLEVLRRLK